MTADYKQLTLTGILLQFHLTKLLINTRIFMNEIFSNIVFKHLI
jgi:hypothetical protein